MAKDGHRDDIPGLPGGAGWCETDQDYCGGEQGECECCGGEMSDAKRGSLPAQAEPEQQPEAPAEQPPVPEVPTGSVHPDEPPDAFRSAENPDAVTDAPVAGEPMGKDQGA